MISYHLIARQCKHIGSTVSCSSVSCVLHFFSSRLFAAIGCPGVFFLWSGSRHWDCFYTGLSPEMQSPKASPKAKIHQRIKEDVGEGSWRPRGWRELCEEVSEGWGLAIEIVMVG